MFNTPLTELQFVAIECLLAGERTGPELLKELKAKGWKRSLAAFYQLMRRLEDAKFVDGRYEVAEKGGYTVRLRRYRALGKGVRAYNETRDRRISEGQKLAGEVANG